MFIISFGRHCKPIRDGPCGLNGRQFKANFPTKSDANLRSILDSISTSMGDESDDEVSLNVTSPRQCVIQEDVFLGCTATLPENPQSFKSRRANDEAQGKLTGNDSAFNFFYFGFKNSSSC